MKYRRKDSDVEAIQWTGDNLKDVVTFLGSDIRALSGWGNQPSSNGLISFITGPITSFAQAGDWIVRLESKSLEKLTDREFQNRYEVAR